MAFDQQSVAANGGVAWAKSVAEGMAPSAIDSQIAGYQAAASAVAQVQTTLRNVQRNLAATWTGDAADTAQATFQKVVDFAAATEQLIGECVAPLTAARSAQTEFVTTMGNLPDEQAVPSTNIAEHAWDWATGQATPTQRVEAHNIGVRDQAAEALNTLSSRYADSENQLTTVAARSRHEAGQNVTPGASGFDLGPVSSSSGDGSASGYGQSVTDPRTSTAGYAGPTPSGSVAPGANAHATTAPHTPNSTPDAPKVPNPGTVLSGTGVITVGPEPDVRHVPTVTDMSGGGGGSSVVYGFGGVISDIPDESYGESLSLRSTGGEGPDEISDGELSGGTGTGSMGGDDVGEGAGSLVLDGESPGSTMIVAGQRVGEGAGDLDSDGGSSQYSRGQQLGDDEDGGEAGPLPPVRSVYENATDAEGNPLSLHVAARGLRARDQDEKDEQARRGKDQSPGD